MSWQDIVNLEVFDDEDPTKWMDDYKRDRGESRLESKEEQENAKREQARKYLEEDVGNVLRELEEFQESGLDEMDLAGEMEDLSKALGKVSVLLQGWI